MQNKRLMVPLLKDVTGGGVTHADTRLLLVVNGLTFRNLCLLATIQQDERRLRRRPNLGDVLDELVSAALSHYGLDSDIPF